MSEVFLTPDLLVDKYYTALYTGDLTYVKSIMTQKSYLMMLDAFGLKLALEDPSFKAELEAAGTEVSSLNKVEDLLSSDLRSRKLSPQIEIIELESNGAQRVTVYYKEDGKSKRLYFSKEKEGWKINYFAGRPITPVSESYFSKIKKKLSQFKIS